MKRAARWFGFTFLFLAFMTLLAWLLGRALSDRFLWCQYLSWLPSILSVPAAAILWMLAAALHRLGRLPSQRKAIGLWGTGVCLAVAMLHFALVELRLHHLPLPPRPTSPHLRILHWNVTAIQRLHQVRDPLLAQHADIAILVNPHSDVGWAAFPEAVAPEFRVFSSSGFVIASRLPVLRYGVAWLGLQGLPPEAESSLPRRHGWTDPGRAMYLELDTREQFGRTTIIWAVDLPSEPKLSRWKIAHDAAAIIASYRGTEIVIRENGSIEGVPSAGFPPPDVVVGDFNMTRGSAAMRSMLPGMHHAFDEAGAGYAATWPRYGYRTPIPLIHVDHMWVSPNTTALRYEIVDPGFGFHQLQVGDVVPGGTPLRRMR